MKPFQLVLVLVALLALVHCGVTSNESEHEPTGSTPAKYIACSVQSQVHGVSITSHYRVLGQQG